MSYNTSDCADKSFFKHISLIFNTSYLFLLERLMHVTKSDIKFEQPCNGDLNSLHEYMYFLAVINKLIFDEGKFTKTILCMSKLMEYLVSLNPQNL